MPPVPAGRSLPLLVGLVIIVAGVAAGVPADTGLDASARSATDDPIDNPVPPSITQIDGTTNYLRVPDADRQMAVRHRTTVDVSESTRIASDRIEIEMAVESFRHRFNATDSTANRTAAVREVTRTLAAKAEAVRQRQQTAIDRYNRGELTTAEFVGVLARVDTSAREIESAATVVRSVDEQTLGYSIPPTLETRLRNLRADVVPARGKLRDVILRPSVTGGGVSNPTYVLTGDDDVVLVSIVSERYAREGFVGEGRNETAPRQFRDYRDAINRTAVLYPWSMVPENNKQARLVAIIGNTSTYKVDVAHDRGEMELYLDGGTTNVFREYQSRTLDDPAVRATRTNSTIDQYLKVNGTHETGPMKVMLTRPGTDNPVDGTVYVDGMRVGRTGPDGQLWVLDTLGATKVRVVSEDGSVSVQFPNGTLPG